MHTPNINKIFTYRRYCQITHYLHYYTPGAAPDPKDPHRDKLFKIRQLVNHMKSKCPKYYICGEQVAIDECIVPFQGRLGIKQYFKDKPTKWGIKVWMLCDSKTSYLFDFDVYCGIDPDFEHLDNINVTSAVVLKLSQDLWGSGRTLYTDRYYTSPTLAYYLLESGMHLCGTRMPNRKMFPRALFYQQNMVSKVIT